MAYGITIGKKMWVVIGILFAVILIALIAYYFYKRGTKKTSVQYAPGDLPYGNAGNGNSQYAGASNAEIKSIASDLRDDMAGFNWAGHDMGPYQRAAVLSDTDFVKLYNTFNGLYQADSGQTLKQWIENEKFWNNEITDALLNRCVRLNLV